MLAPFCKEGTGAQRSCLSHLLPLLEGLFCRQAVRTKRKMSLGGRFLLSLRRSFLTVIAAPRQDGLPCGTGNLISAGVQASQQPQTQQWSMEASVRKLDLMALRSLPA